MKIAGKEISIKHIDGPVGVRGRNSDNNLFLEKLGWRISESLDDGLRKLILDKNQVETIGEDVGLKQNHSFRSSLTIPLTIITVSFNSEKTIGETLESLKVQNNKNFEHIIIDGNSKDGTIKIVNQYPFVTKIISEKDDGIMMNEQRHIKQPRKIHRLFK